MGELRAEKRSWSLRTVFRLWIRGTMCVGIARAHGCSLKQGIERDLDADN